MRVTKVTEVTKIKPFLPFFLKNKLKSLSLNYFRNVTSCRYVTLIKTSVTLLNTKVTERKLKLKKQLFLKNKADLTLTFVTFVTNLTNSTNSLLGGD